MGLNFVVQRENWREMRAFVAIEADHYFDAVRFTVLRPVPKRRNWYIPRAVHLSRHPQHIEFVRTLADPVFRRSSKPCVFMDHMSQWLCPTTEGEDRKRRLALDVGTPQMVS